MSSGKSILRDWRFWGVCMLPAFGCVGSGYLLIYGYAMRAAPIVVEGRVDSCVLGTKSLYIHYSYSVGGRRYTSNDAMPILTGCSEGDSLTVHASTMIPTASELRQGRTLVSGIGSLLVTLFLCAASAIVYRQLRINDAARA